jgi:hypothetical protein
MRLCIDYRRLNEVTLPDAYRLPRQDDTMDALGGSTIFSVLDISHGLLIGLTDHQRKGDHRNHTRD